MAKGDLVPADEELVRALYYPLWSAEHNRATSLAFTQMNVSVSRLAVLPYESIVAIFRADLKGKPTLVATCSATVADILKACAEHPKAGLIVRVVEDPIEAAEGVSANPAHAEIRAFKPESPQIAAELTRGMAN